MSETRMEIGNRIHTELEQALRESDLALKQMRQEAKMLHFGRDRAMGAMKLVLQSPPQLTDEECLERFTLEQRADGGSVTHFWYREWLLPFGWVHRFVPRLSAADRDRARALWARGVTAKVDADAADRAARAPRVLVQGDWVDEDENL